MTLDKSSPPPNDNASGEWARRRTSAVHLLSIEGIYGTAPHRTAIAVIWILAVVAGCSKDAAVTEQPATRSSTVQSRTTVERAAFAARLKGARERIRPVVAVHREAMRDLRKNFAYYTSGGGTKIQHACRAGERLGQKYAARLAVAHPRALKKENRSAAIRYGLSTVKSCGQAMQGSVFSGAAKRTPQDPFGVHFQQYHAVIEGAAYSWDGMTNFQQVVETAVMNMPLQYPLTNEETDALAAMVELVSTSFQDASELPLPDHPDDEYELASVFSGASIWPGKTFWKKIATVAITDLGGFFGGALAHNILNNDVEDYEFQDSLTAGAAAAVTGSATIAVQCVLNVGNCRSTGS